VRDRTRIILAASNIILIILLIALGNSYIKLYSDNLALRKELIDLENKINVFQKQLEYYKALTTYIYENTTGIDLASSLFRSLSFHAVAVKSGTGGYEGVVLNISISIVPGKGRIFVNTEPKIGIDLQTSIEVARIVAVNYTGINLSFFDIILSVTADQEVEIVDGPSAGAVITVLLISFLLNKTLNQNVYLTGTINPDGSIGRVGAIMEKALAAAENGAKIFLVPKGERVVTVYVEERTEIVPGFVIITYKPVKIDVEEYLKEKGYDIKIIEVGSIEDILSLLWRP
jgi:uncharacterized protein